MIDLAILGALTVALRIPALLTERHLTFDDGVFGASSVAMRDGSVPFREVFSSQGPLFLPLVRFFDLVGFETLNAPRLLGIASALVLVAATYAAARGFGDRVAGLVAALLVTTSGSILWVTGPIAADGPALAAATVAVTASLAYTRRPSWFLAIVIGLTMGVALSIKATTAPALAIVAWVLLAAALRRTDDGRLDLDSRGLLRLLAAGGCALAVWMVPALVFGVADVWDQSVTYHQEATTGRDIFANVAKIASTLFDRDLPVIAFAVLAGVSVAIRGVPLTDERAAWPQPRPTRLLWVWLALSFVLLLYIHPLWRPHMSGLIPPAALLIAAYRPRARDALIAGLVLVPIQAWRMADYLHPDDPHPRTVALMEEFENLPPDAWIISDDPGQVWRAGRRTPDDLVDTSILRIESGRITSESLAAAAGDERVCAVVVWSSVRFGSFEELPDLLGEAGYEPAATFDDHRVLYVRDRCLTS